MLVKFIVWVKISSRFIAGLQFIVLLALHHHPHKPWDILYFWTKFIVWSIHNFAYIYVYKSHALHHHLHKHWDNLYFLTKSIVWCQFIILLILVQITGLVVIIINVGKIHSLGKTSSRFIAGLQFIVLLALIRLLHICPT